LYISVFFALGVFVSTLTTRASTSFLVLLFLWMALVIVIPGASVIAAKYVKPIPSSSLITSQKGLFWFDTHYQVSAEVTKKINEFLPEANQRLQRLREEDPGRVPEYTAKINEEVSKISSGMRQEIDDRVEAHNIKINMDYQLQKDAQRNLARNIAGISPAAALSFGSMTLARTGIDEYDRFLAATRAYRPIFRNWVNNINSSSDFRDSGTGAMRPIDVSIIPQLPYVPERLGRLLIRTLPDFALMAVMIIVFLTGAYFAFLRYDVR